MTDARLSNIVRSWVDKISLAQELLVLAGVVLFFVGLAAPSSLVRIVAFIASGSAFAYFIVTLRTMMRAKGGVQASEADSTGDSKKDQSAADLSEIQSTVSIPKVSRPTPVEYVFNPSDFSDPEEQAFARDAGPKSEFSSLLKKALTVVKEVHFAHTVAFFWVNREKNQLVLENYVTDSEQFASHRRREIGSDLISQVALTGTPRIVNQVNQMGQAEILGYYQNVEAVKSFVAVPIFFPKSAGTPTEPVAVLSLDSRGEDAFGPETMMSLGHFAKLTSALIRSYTGKYDLLVDSEILRSVSRLHEQMTLEMSVHNIVRSLAEETSRLVSWDYISVILFNEMNNSWTISFVMNRMNDSYVSMGHQIDPSNSIAGQVIHASAPKIYESISKAGVARFYQAERVETSGALLALPLNSSSRCYGALMVESKDQKTYSENDVKVLEKIVRTAVSGLEIFSLTEVVNNYVSLDETTGVATRKFFIERLHEEVQRAKDFGLDLTVVMISVDAFQDQLNRIGKDGFDFVLQNVGRMIKSSVRHYDLVGRFDYNRFTAMLVHTTTNEGYLWAEKLRRNIAGNVINLDQKSFSVTVSIGICGAVSEANDMELMENANKVLAKAVEAGGNMVRVF